MHHDELLFAALVLLAASTVSIVLFHRAGMGSILGLLTAGILVGPSGLAITTEVAQLREVTELGIVFLLFIIGLEMRPARLWSMRRLMFGLGTLQLVITGAVLSLGAALMGHSAAPAIVLGLGLALSSTAFVIQLLEQRGELLTPFGQHAFSILLLQDMAIVPLLALVPLLAGAPVLDPISLLEQSARVVLALGGVILLGHWLLPRALNYVARQRNSEALAGLSALAVIASAWAMQVAGVSMALGAFLMGMLLSRSRFHHQLEADVAPFKGLLLSLFFVSVGMSIDLALLSRNVGSIFAIVFILLLVKGTILYILGVAFGLRRMDAVRLACTLPQGGEFGFVLFAAAMSAGLIEGSTFVHTILVISISMVLTPLLARLGAALAERFGDLAGDTGPLDEAAASLDRHVLICGYGRAGRTIGEMLRTVDVPFVAVERAPERVEACQAQGHPVFFGNAIERGLLERAGVGKASLIVITLDRPAAVRRLVSAVRSFDAEVPILTRARDHEEGERIVQLGVNEFVPEAFEMSLALGAATLSRVGIDDEQIAYIAAEIRNERFRHLQQAAPKSPDERLPQSLDVAASIIRSKRSRTPPT